MTDVRHTAPSAPAGGAPEPASAGAPESASAGGLPEPASAGASEPGTGSADAGTWLAPAIPPRRRARRVGRGARTRVAVVGAVLLAAVGFLLYEGLGSSLDYYVTVRQALSQRTTLAHKTFRLQGIVLPGTVTHHGTTVDFTVAQSGDRRLQIPVVNHGEPPQLFKAGVPVIVQGGFNGGTFVSDQLIVDHTGNYSPQRDGPRSAGSGSAGSGSSASS